MEFHLNPRSILVLCEGNHCRSPIAEALLREALGGGVTVESAGLGAQNGFGAHALAIQLMGEQGINLTSFRSRQLKPAMALKADLILVMDQNQKAWCERLAPGVRDRVFLLGHWLPPERQEIEDPFHKPNDIFFMVFQTICQAVAAWRDHLKATPGTP
jgi:protein-tyrosine phosphatase